MTVNLYKGSFCPGTILHNSSHTPALFYKPILTAWHILKKNRRHTPLELIRPFSFSDLDKQGYRQRFNRKHVCVVRVRVTVHYSAFQRLPHNDKSCATALTCSHSDIQVFQLCSLRNHIVQSWMKSHFVMFLCIWIHTQTLILPAGLFL